MTRKFNKELLQGMRERIWGIDNKTYEAQIANDMLVYLENAGVLKEDVYEPDHLEINYCPNCLMGVEPPFHMHLGSSCNGQPIKMREVKE